MEVEFTGNLHMGCSPSKLQFKENVHLHTILQEIMLFADMIERKEKENVTINLWD